MEEGESGVEKRYCQLILRCIVEGMEQGNRASLSGEQLWIQVWRGRNGIASQAYERMS